MSQHNSRLSPATDVAPVISNLFASFSDAQGFWVKEGNVPIMKSEGEAIAHPLSPPLLGVDIARDLRSAQYNRSKAKSEAKLVLARKSKRQGRSRREYSTKHNKGGKRSGKRQPISHDLATDSEVDCEQGFSDPVLQEHRETTFIPIAVRTSEDQLISTRISPESQPPTEKSPKGYTPPDAYTTTTLPESTFDIPAPDISREFRSYERHRHQTKKSARFAQLKQKKGARAKPVLARGSRSTKAENLRNLVNLTIVDETTSSEDEIQTPVEVSLSLILPDVECADSQLAATVDMEALITTAKIKLAKEPGFELVGNVRQVIALDDGTTKEDDDEPWEHVWNDDLVD